MATESASTQDVMKVLLVAHEEFRGSDFLNELRSHIEGRSAEVEVYVIAPALADSGIEHEMADFDGPIKEAGERLENILAELKEVGIEAVGRVGDGDPILAIGDGLREFEADEIIVVAHDDEDSTYGEKNLWKNIQGEFHPPVVELIVSRSADGSGAPKVVDTNRDEGREVTEEEKIETTRNFPPLTKRDVIGILVGFFGTAALALISLDAATGHEGNYNGPRAAILLLTIGAFLLNVGHIVGLVFFQSVRYTGIWEKFMARMSMIYTIAALIAAVILWQFI
ncbi:MAG: universal stress protein [Actinomycetota bacterium]|nr:universal stress protein [Actinomycetota bacterium]